jgi:hypothetical protein
MKTLHEPPTYPNIFHPVPVLCRHYELYRKERLKQMGFSEGGEGSSGTFAETYTLRRENHLKSLQEREEEMRQKFVLR